MTQFCASGQTVAVEFVDAAAVGVDRFAHGGEAEDGEFFETFAKPIEARRSAGVFEWEDQVDLGPGGVGGCSRSAKRMASAEQRRMRSLFREAGTPGKLFADISFSL
jgi:hypothetical protein